MTTLFKLEIPPTGDGASGSVVCTSPAPLVYLLTFNAPPDNRLVTNFCQTLLLALDIIEFSHPPGVVITTSAITKFYSNGLDLEHAGATKGFFPDSLFKLFARFLTYPMPTISLLNGHAFAGGFMLSMHHDYRVFNPSRGFLCLNELDFGVALKAAMSSIFRQKLADPTVYRSMVLEAKRFGGKDALEGGIVDVLGGLEETLKLIADRKLTEKAKSGVYGLMKAEMYRESLGYLQKSEEQNEINEQLLDDFESRKKQGRDAVAKWEKAGGKAKL